MNPRPDEIYDVYEARIAALEARIETFEAQLERKARAPSRFDLTKSAEKYGLLVAWVVLILGFGIMMPTMFTWPPYASMFGFNSIVVVLTLGLIIPLTAGDFDLSVASTLTLSAMIV